MPTRASRARSAGSEDAAFADHQPVAGDQRRQRLAGRQRGLERPQVAVVDADHRRAKFQGAIEFAAVMDFDQHVHAVRDRGVLDIAGGAVVERGHDDQDAVGAMGARLDHLIGVEHEILAQHRQCGRRARRHHEIEMALERRRVGQHRETGRASGFIGLGKRRRIEIGANQPLGGRGFFHFGDQRVVAASELAADRTRQNRVARGRISPALRGSRADARAWRRRFPRACKSRSWSGCRTSRDPSDQPLETAISCFSLAAAAPLSSDLAPRLTPSFRSLARPATISAAAALSSATSR